nr:MAG TPA: hypothetical protein [Caudoviricetes sp.]
MPPEVQKLHDFPKIGYSCGSSGSPPDLNSQKLSKSVTNVT